MKTLFYLLFLSSSILFAEYKVSGTVKDSMSGNVLPGANVFIQSIGVGAIVDFDGNFELTEVPVGSHELTISLISYKNKTIEVAIIDNDIDNIEILLDSAPISKTKIVVEGKQSLKNIIKPVFKVRFNGLYKSYNSSIITLPPELSVSNTDAYENVFLREVTNPEFLVGISSQINNNFKIGFLMNKSEQRISLQSSYAKMALGRANSSAVFSIGGIYNVNDDLNLEFDLNIYNIIENTIINKTKFQNNLTASISLSTNFD